MKFFPVVNLDRRLGQGKLFETLSDLDLARICGAVNKFNEWKDWADTPTGDRYRRDAIADVQSIISKVPRDIQHGAIQDIENYCDGSADLIGFLNLKLFGTPPVTTPNQPPVATTDRSREPEPPPPNTNPPVATGQPGPGRGAFRPLAPVATTGTIGPPYMPPIMEESTFPTGSEAPFEVSNREENQPPPPPSMPAPVASVGSGCYYVSGQGYVWGPAPSGGQPTGLSKSDCDSIRQRYNEVASIPNTTPPTPQVTNTSQEHASLYNPNAPMAPAGRPDVATGGGCDPMKGQFPDGHGGCRGSVSGGFGNLVNQAMNLGPSGGGGMVTPGNLDNILTGKSIGMGRRFPVVNL